MKRIIDWDEYSKLARKAGAEGCVLLRNNDNVLPIKASDKVCIFGRTQFDYSKSGTGSGGSVNTPYVVNIYEGLKNAGINVCEEVSDKVRDFIKENPFNTGEGWGGQPFGQKEMVPDEDLLKLASKDCDIALVIIGRTCGEDHDCLREEGSYYLTQDERKMISMVASEFARTAVILNIGNLINMEWIDEFNIPAVMCVWQGGAEGGNSIADVLTGNVNPSGRLSDTIAYDAKDWPSDKNFGDTSKIFYAEDVYLGYRYFETFAKDRVQFPFGFGLSYTEFKKEMSFNVMSDSVVVNVGVTNIGKLPGKEVVQVYCKAPQGKLGKPLRSLVGFVKTKRIAPQKSDEVSVSVLMRDLASFDDSGITGHKNCFVCEAGDYEFYAGDNARDAVLVGSFNIQDDVVTEETQDALYPRTAFDRMVPKASGDGYEIAYAPVPLRTMSNTEHAKAEQAVMPNVPCSGNKGITLYDVADGKATMDEFVNQMTDMQLIYLSRGEGMCSRRVTLGTAACFGGVTDDLEAMGIAPVCCSDGPSGIRMDNGSKAMQAPSATALACTFNTELIYDLYEYMGREIRYNKIDCLLGPGMNLHRHPLCGRNFEYFSEDPYLTGACAAAELRGLHKSGVTGVVKHFCANNQEAGRYSADSIVSARALRELYLKGFKMAIDDGGAYCIMTTYGILNGTHTASNFDLNDMVLRKDWGFEGLSMTDWWAKINEEDCEPSITQVSKMIRARNNTYMVCSTVSENTNKDDCEEGLKDGTYSRADLIRNAKDILSAVMRTPAFERRHLKVNDEWEILNSPVSIDEASDVELYIEVADEATLDETLILNQKGKVNHVHARFADRAFYVLSFETSADGPELSQIPMTVKFNGEPVLTVTRNGADHEWKREELEFDARVIQDDYVKFIFAQDGMSIRNIKFTKK